MGEGEEGVLMQGGPFKEENEGGRGGGCLF